MNAPTEMAQDFGCKACWPSAAEEAWKAIGSLPVLSQLVQESHFSVKTRQCPACGQAFVTTFAETVDWMDGEDPQYQTAMPLTEQELAELSSTGNVESELGKLAPQRHSLRSDFPKGSDKKEYWGQGCRIGPHD